MPGLIIPRFPHRRLERGSLHRDVIGGLLVVLLLTGALRGELSVAFAHPIRLLEAQLKVKLLLGDLALLELFQRPVVVVEVVKVVLRLHLSALRGGEPLLVLRLGGGGGGFLSFPLFPLLAAVGVRLGVRGSSRSLLGERALPLLLASPVLERHRVRVNGRLRETLQRRLGRLANLLHPRQPQEPERAGQPRELEFLEPEDEAAVVLLVPPQVRYERSDALLHRLAVLLGPGAELVAEPVAALDSLRVRGVLVGPLLVGILLVGILLLGPLLLGPLILGLFILGLFFGPFLVLLVLLLFHAASAHLLPERLQPRLLRVSRAPRAIPTRGAFVHVQPVNLPQVYVPHPQKLHVRRLVRRQEQQRAAVPSHPRGAPDPVHERRRVLRRVELDDPVDARDVQTPRRHVGA